MPPRDRQGDVVKHMDDKASKAGQRASGPRVQTERTDLQKEWGTNWEFNRLTAMQGAKRAAGSDEGAAKLIDAMQKPIGYKNTMEFWRKIGAGTTEDTFVDNQPAATRPRGTAPSPAKRAYGRQGLGEPLLGWWCQ
jgi:hypothetical protein